MAGFKASHLLAKALFAFLLLAAVVVAITKSTGTSPAGAAVAAIPPTTARTDISTCMKGLTPSSGEALSFERRLEACDMWAATDRTFRGRFYRAQLLFDEGTTQDHLNQAFADLSLLIDNDRYLFAAYAQRSLLQEYFLGDREAALADTTAAIETALSSDGQADGRLAHLYVNRSRLRAQDMRESAVITATHDILNDMEAALRIDPENEHLRVARLRTLSFIEEMEHYSIAR